MSGELGADWPVVPTHRRPARPLSRIPAIAGRSDGRNRPSGPGVRPLAGQFYHHLPRVEGIDESVA